MLLVKQELLAALANTLESFSPGAGAKAAFESPKVAAHGDFASTAAMQLAKPLKLNPRQVAEGLKAALLATPVYQRWVDAIEIAGPERAPFDQFVRRYLSFEGDRRTVWPDPEQRYFGSRIDQLSLVPLAEARLGRMTLAAWDVQRAAAAGARVVEGEAR